MRIELDADVEPSELKCPRCESTSMHHFKVEVFDRDEDKKSGLHATIEAGSVKIDHALDLNPSHRRHGLSIHFWCENCHELSVLALAQHKGSTQIEIFPTGKAADVEQFQR